MQSLQFMIAKARLRTRNYVAQSMARKPAGSNIVFRRTWKIGAPDAESDKAFLDACFVDTGALDELRNCQEPRRIVIGRTGIGKTALLKKLTETEENVIELAPEILSLNYISNSQIIQFLEDIGVHLELFYKLLWDHVLAVELLKRKYDIKNKSSFKNFFDNILPNFSGQNIAREQAVEYLTEWGDKFWEETEYRVKEFTTKLETDLEAALGAEFSKIGFSAEVARNLTSEQKGEIKQRATETVNKVQIKALHSLISLLDDYVFTDSQEKYFIVIDRLDEGWVDNSVRYKLIKALIEAVRNFQSIRNVKIVVSLRTDLLQRVLRDTATPGFQDEKYEALYLKLRWSENELEEIIDRRINYIFKDKYTGQNVHIRDIMPANQIEKTDPIGYIFRRTSLRPREVIMYINECIEKAEGKTKFTLDIIRSAEASYSQKRVISLTQEWNDDYPNLDQYLMVLKNMPVTLGYGDIDTSEIFDVVTQHVDQSNSFEDELTNLTGKYLDNEAEEEDVKDCWISIMYRVGVLGVKPEPAVNVQWSFLDEGEIPQSYTLKEMQFSVHPEYWTGLGLSQRKLDSRD